MADFSHMRGKRRSVEERFWEKVDRRGADECWPWIARLDTKGYGQFFFEGKQQRAHRVSYLLSVGPIPVGLDLDHVRERGCSTRACVNPSHLEPVDRAENLLRGDTIPAAHAAKTHCPRNHEYTPENTRMHHGSRECKRCISERAKESRRVQRALAA